MSVRNAVRKAINELRFGPEAVVYADWMAGYLAAGGSVNGLYERNFLSKYVELSDRDVRNVWATDFVVAKKGSTIQPAYGVDSKTFLIPKGLKDSVKIIEANSHNQVYFLDNFTGIYQGNPIRSIHGAALYEDIYKLLKQKSRADILSKAGVNIDEIYSALLGDNKKRAEAIESFSISYLPGKPRPQSQASSLSDGPR